MVATHHEKKDGRALSSHRNMVFLRENMERTVTMDGTNTAEPGLTSDDEGDMEIQQLVGHASPRSRILPRRPSTSSLRLFQNTDPDGQLIFQEATTGFVSPLPRSHSANSLLGEAFLSSCNPSERGLRRSQHYLEGSPTSSLDGTTTPSFPDSSQQQHSPPPLSQKTGQYVENHQEQIVAANTILKGKLPPRQPCKDRSGFSSVHSRANSETSLLSALTMDTSHGQGHNEHEKRRVFTIETSLQQPILYDDEQKSLSSSGLPFMLKPSHRRRSSWSFTSSPSKRSLPRAVYLPECDAWDKTSDSTAFNTVSGSSAQNQKGLQSVRDLGSVATRECSV